MDSGIAEYSDYNRIGLLGGPGLVERLASTSVLVFGVGGVGSWAVEALVRSGIGRITVVDSDCVAPSNINRQLPALVSTVGRPKVEVLAARMAEINPQCRITALCTRYTPGTADTFDITSYDYVIDAIDSIADKADLILRCTDPVTAPKVAFFSSMGAARKVDSSRISVAEFWSVEGCPLARTLRTRFRRAATYPRRKFRCVFSSEPPLPQKIAGKGIPNGSLAHITGAFGLKLAELVFRSVSQI